MFALQRQVKINERFVAREELQALNYEVLNNLVVELTRLSIDLKNHKIRVESVAGRLDFDERRARAARIGRPEPVAPADRGRGGPGRRQRLVVRFWPAPSSAAPLRRRDVDRPQSRGTFNRTGAKDNAN